MKELSIRPDQNIEAIREEFASLKRRATEPIEALPILFFPVHIVFALTITAVVAVNSRELPTTLFAVAIAWIYPGPIVSVILALILAGVVGSWLERTLTKRRLTRDWYHRYIYLKQIVSELDEAERLRTEEEKHRQDEARRIRLLPLQMAVADYRKQVDAVSLIVSNIESVLQRKRKWYDEYRGYEESIEQCLFELNELKGESRELGILFAELSKEAPFLLRVLVDSIEHYQNRCESLLIRIQSLKDWTPPVRRTVRTSNRERTGAIRQRILIPGSPRPSIIQSEDSSEAYDFSHPETIQQPILVAPPKPPKRRVLNKQLKKIPFEDYVGAAKLKMETGELGEIIALHYEIRRVEEETGRSGDGQVRRVSEESDSYGYDIESYSQGETVYIEVKSTTGTFDTDFFLTANERNVMKEKRENYWLYRIFELSKEDGSAKLSVFRGRSEIEASFELEPTNYRMNPKESASDGMLPFDILK